MSVHHVYLGGTTGEQSVDDGVHIVDQQVLAQRVFGIVEIKGLGVVLPGEPLHVVQNENADTVFGIDLGVFDHPRRRGQRPVGRDLIARLRFARTSDHSHGQQCG